MVRRYPTSKKAIDGFLYEESASRVSFRQILNKADELYNAIKSEMKHRYKGFDYQVALSRKFKEKVREDQIKIEDAITGCYLIILKNYQED